MSPLGSSRLRHLGQQFRDERRSPSSSGPRPSSPASSALPSSCCCSCSSTASSPTCRTPLAGRLVIAVAISLADFSNLLVRVEVPTLSWWRSPSFASAGAEVFLGVLEGIVVAVVLSIRSSIATGGRTARCSGGCPDARAGTATRETSASSRSRTIRVVAGGSPVLRQRRDLRRPGAAGGEAPAGVGGAAVRGHHRHRRDRRGTCSSASTTSSMPRASTSPSSSSARLRDLVQDYGLEDPRPRITSTARSAPPSRDIEPTVRGDRTPP